MESNLKKRNVQRKRRAFRVRKAIKGNAVRPRFSVFKSNKNLSVQIIDDESSVTLLSLSTLQDIGIDGKTKEAAKKLGVMVADMAKKKNIESVVFDRGHNKYHGVLAELANAARESGLQF
jgi:large subunit ribosomal protein L18